MSILQSPKYFVMRFLTRSISFP